MQYDVTYYSDSVYCIEHFLSPAECAEMIKLSEDLGYEQATVNTGYSHEVIDSIRNNDRVIYDNYHIAQLFWGHAKDYLPKIPCWHRFSFNERFRFYRYKESQIFRWHSDGAYKRKPTEVSKVTFIIYLNDDFEGGSTDFKAFKVQPKIGSALVFPHKIVHQGSATTRGTKYVIRTDVMYQRAPSPA